MIKIKPFKGYDIYYDESRKCFSLEKDGNEVASASTQDELEEKANKLVKTGFKRIPIFSVNSNGFIQRGELTSVNKETFSAYINMKSCEGFSWPGKRKVNLAYTVNADYYEKTEANEDILKDIAAKNTVLVSLTQEIKALRGKLEKPINRKYFDIGEG